MNTRCATLRRRKPARLLALALLAFGLPAAAGPEPAGTPAAQEAPQQAAPRAAHEHGPAAQTPARPARATPPSPRQAPEQPLQRPASSPAPSAAADRAPAPRQPAKASATGGEPLLKLGPGDAITVNVFGRPELTTTTYVADDGSIPVPLAGSVRVGGLSPAAAGARIAEALRDGQYVLNPQVSVLLTEFRSQQVSVLGEVRTPGRFPIQSRTTVLDLLAQAGGITENGSNTVLLLRPGADGQITRTPVEVTGLRDGRQALRAIAIRGGDSIVVPEADRYYVYGEVHAPNAYRLNPGMTVVQALATSGGVTTRGSERRIEIRRRNGNGDYETLSAELTDRVQKDDVIRVKERIF